MFAGADMQLCPYRTILFDMPAPPILLATGTARFKLNRLDASLDVTRVTWLRREQEKHMPRYGFNFLWIFGDSTQPPQPPDERALDFLAKHGFDFVRVPCNYWFWTTDFRYYEPDETVLAYLDRYLAACRQRGLQMNLNLHRAPGYCINRNNLEKHNLWKDQEAQDAFVFLWETFARRYKGVPNDQLSFDLLNEPPGVGDYGFTREIHAAVMRRTVAAIRAIDPAREIVIDGIGAGSIAVPELADLGVIHSTRGYQPMPVSHNKATWWRDWQTAPEPILSRCGMGGARLEPRGAGRALRALARGRSAAACQSTSASSAATTRRLTRLRCAGSPTCSAGSTSTAGAIRCGTSRDRSASSSMDAPARPTKCWTATTWIARCSICCWRIG